MCNICNVYNCSCRSASVTNQITSDQAGRAGLSAKQILINIGRLPANATDADFANYIQGGTTIVNTQMYAKTDW